MVGARREEGSALVEAAIVLPLFVAFLGVCLQFAFVLYSAIDLESNISKTLSVVNLTDLSSSGDCASQLESKLVENAILADADLTVDNARVTIAESSSSAPVEGHGSTASTIGLSGETACLSADVSYRFPAIIKGLGFENWRLTRHIESSQNIQTTVEVR